jgi:hypothetical protein
MQVRRHSRGTVGHERRSGAVLVIELLFVLPIMLIFLLAIAQFYLVVCAREELLAASRLGARVAAASDPHRKEEVREEVAKVVKRALGHGRLSTAAVKVTWADELPPKDTAGEADWVQVSLDIPLRRVTPDVLGWVGFALGKQHMVVATTMKQE